jgi:glutathione synthase/RimK-type ligase-like ATP-grasp enzyme
MNRTSATRVAFCTNIPLRDAPESLRGRNHAIAAYLRCHGHEVEVLFGPEAFLGRGPMELARRYDVGLFCPNDLYEAAPDPEGRFRAQTCALILEAGGTPFVNSPLRRQFASNKLLAHAIMAGSAIPQPDVWTVEQGADLAWPSDGLVVKPVVGSGGHGVAVVHTADEAKRHAQTLAQPCLLQTYIRNARCIRVVATKRHAIGRYEKRVPEATLVASVASGAEEVCLPPREELDELAAAMVRASQMDVAGVDILEDPLGRLFALEVNANFGFFPRNREILEAIQACALEKAVSPEPRVVTG